MAITISGNGITSANIADGTITTDDINASDVTSLKSGRKNLIINGAMQVAQRGTSSTLGSFRTLDRFRNNADGSSVTQSQESLTNGTPYDEGFRYFYRQTNTATSSATSANMQIFEPIEAQNIAQSGWNYKSVSSYITCQFWVRSSLAGTYHLELRSKDGTGQLYASQFTITANTWTKVTKTIPGNTNITVDNDNGEGLQVNIVAHYGTDFTDSGFTYDAWGAFSSGSRATDMAQNWCNTASATFDVTGVQLELGDTATDFEHRSYGEELALCKRYYEEINLYGYLTNKLPAYNDHQTIIKYEVEKRTTPTLSTPTCGNFQPGGGTGTVSHSKTGVSSNTVISNSSSGGSYDTQIYNSGTNVTIDAEL